MKKQLRAFILKNCRLLRSNWISNLIYLLVLPIILIVIVYSTYNKLIVPNQRGDAHREEIISRLFSNYELYPIYCPVWKKSEAILDSSSDNSGNKFVRKLDVAFGPINLYTDAKELDNYLYESTSSKSSFDWSRRFALEYLNDTAYTLMYKDPNTIDFGRILTAIASFKDMLEQIFFYRHYSELARSEAESQLFRNYNYSMNYLRRKYQDYEKVPYGMLGYGLALSLLLVFVTATSSLLSEKKDRILILTRLNGMKLSPYMISHVIFYYIFALIPAILIIVLGLAFEFPLFKYPVVPMLIILTSGLSAVGLSLLASIFLPVNRLSTLITLSVLTVSSLIASLTFMFEIDHAVLYLIPLYSTAKLLNLFTYYNAFSLSTSLWLKDGAVAGLILHFLQPFVYYILAVYFFQVYNQKSTGISRPLLFPLYSLVRWAKKRLSKRSDMAFADEPVQFEDQLHLENELMDEDVRREVHNAYDMKNKNNPLILKNVFLTYPGGKTAVNGVSFTAENGIVFGLLGPNGAGKTSLINIMAGVHKHTSGKVLIAGYNIRSEPEKVYENIGYCPQHDIYWSKLSVEHHIQFFLQLKGACKTKAEEDAKLETLLSLVSLQKQRKQAACSLSGGEKRRLSLALAFCGSGRVVFLDEPTTGLDPEVRSMIWKIIQEAKPGRLLILTTHSMEEAEKLSDKITIMAKGMLKCFGAPQYLKNKYGGKIIINLTSSKESLAAALKSIVALCPDQMKICSQSGSIGKIQFNGNKTEIPILYEKIEALIHATAKDGQPMIDDWGFDQPSLGEVFVSLVSETEAAA